MQADIPDLASPDDAAEEAVQLDKDENPSKDEAELQADDPYANNFEDDAEEAVQLEEENPTAEEAEL